MEPTIGRGVTRRDLLRGIAAASVAPGVAACTPSSGGGGTVRQSWHIANFASKFEISGYVDRPSLNRGEVQTLRLNCRGFDAGATVQAAVHRTGWYDGVGAATYVDAFALTAPAEQPATAVVDPVTNRCEADWPTAWEFATSTGGDPWPSGVYVIHLTSASGKEAYVPFTLRDDASSASVLVVQSQLTWQAYSRAGGHDLYHDGTAVSFRRPYSDDQFRFSLGAGEYFWLEYRIVRWLERAGFDVTYVADFDLHRAPVPPSTRVVLLCGHPEYWTEQMRLNVEAAMAARGTGLVALGANTCYWRGRLEGATATHPGNYVLWKTDGGGPHPLDPLRDDPVLGSRMYRKVPGRAEQMLLGGQFRGWVDANAYSPPPALNATAMVAYDTSHPVFAGTGIAPGDSFRGLCGGEFDRYDPQYTPALGAARTLAFRTPLDWVFNNFHDVTRVEYQESSLHEKNYPGGITARVFNAGTYTWAWGLDDFSFEPYRFGFADDRIRQLTSNILHWAAKD